MSLGLATGLLVLVATLASPAGAAERRLAAQLRESLHLRWVPASWKNFERPPRPPSRIRFVVVHVAQTTYEGTVRVFRRRHAGVSAHYVVSARGEVTQMVRDFYAGWHAGNGYYNRHSIGIEHAGWVKRPEWFTEAEYRASARLVASLVRRYRIPLDRRHIVGHNQVPDPIRPRRRGGISHHTDPGRHWNWRKYMSYIRLYARRGPDALPIHPRRKPARPPEAPAAGPLLFFQLRRLA